MTSPEGPPDNPGLPHLPDDQKDSVDFKKLRYQAELDVYKANHAAGIALAQAGADVQNELTKAFLANEYTQAQAIQAAYVDVAKGALDRAVTKAEFVQKAAAAVSSVYAGVLGLTFAVSEGKFLPVRGLVPAFFLGLSIVLVAAYLSFLTKAGYTVPTVNSGLVPLDQLERRNNFLKWTRGPTERRLFALRAAIVSLALGALLLPLPFLDMEDRAALYIGLVGLVPVIVIPLVADI